MIISILNLVSNYCCNKDPEFGSHINFIGLIVQRTEPPSSSVVFALTRIEHDAPQHVTEPPMFTDPAAIGLTAPAVRLPAREIRSTPLISRVEADTVPCSIT